MSEAARKTDPALWGAVKHRLRNSDKGGRPGQWSAREAPMATAEYEKEGGGYAGKKGPDNPLQQWTGAAWGTKSGAASGTCRGRPARAWPTRNTRPARDASDPSRAADIGNENVPGYAPGTFLDQAAILIGLGMLRSSGVAGRT